MFDVLIIGGGVIGCSVARELSRYNIKIGLLEKTEDICNGQSKANTAIVHGGYDAKPGTKKAFFNVMGNKMFEEITEELQVPFKRNTSLVVSFDKSGLKKLNELKAQGEKNGVEGLKIIDKEELFTLEPNISKEACNALLVPNGGIVCPYELTQAYAENAAENGVEFFRNTEALNIYKEDEIWIIETNNGIFKTKVIVNAAGVYSDIINNMVSEEKIKIVPRKGEYYILDKDFSDKFNATIFQLPTDMGKGVLVAPTVDGTILIGPTSEDIEDKENKATTSNGLESALSAAKKTWEDIPQRSFITTFTGLRAHSLDNDFIIGEVEDAPMFFNAAGIESPGLTSAPAISSHLAKEIASKLNASLKNDFNPIRKAIPKFREMNNSQRAQAISSNPDYAKIVCRCETITEAEIRESIRRPVGARSLDGIKRRTRAGMGRCQSGFCSPRVLEILCEELRISPLEVTKCGGNSNILTDYIFKEEGDEYDA